MFVKEDIYVDKLCIVLGSLERDIELVALVSLHEIYSGGHKFLDTYNSPIESNTKQVVQN